MHDTCTWHCGKTLKNIGEVLDLQSIREERTVRHPLIKYHSP